MIIGVVASYIVLIGGFLVLHKYIVGVHARDDILLQCMIHHAYLEILDANEMTSEEKVSRLSKAMTAKMGLHLAVLETLDTFAVSDLMRVDMGIPDDDFNKAKKNIRDYLDSRAGLESQTD